MRYRRQYRHQAGPLALLLMLIFAPAATRAEGPKPFTAVYEVKMGNMAVGTMVRKLVLAKDRGYEFSSEVEATGIATLFQDGRIVESSKGAFVDHRPQPDRYDYRQPGGKKNRALAVAFDWKTGTVTTLYKGRETRGTLKPGILDKLVYQIALMHDLATSGAQFTYSIADSDGVTDYVLARRGTEAVATARGTFNATRVERVNGSSKRRTVLWCAQELGYLPVRIEHREKDGKVTTALLQRVD